MIPIHSQMYTHWAWICGWVINFSFKLFSIFFKATNTKYTGTYYRLFTEKGANITQKSSGKIHSRIDFPYFRFNSSEISHARLLAAVRTLNWYLILHLSKQSDNRNTKLRDKIEPGRPDFFHLTMHDHTQILLSFRSNAIIYFYRMLPRTFVSMQTT